MLKRLLPRVLPFALLACALAATPPDVGAQNLPWPSSRGMTVDDTDVGILIRYVGAQVSGTVQVSSGDLLLKHGALAGEIADTTITGCGGTAGTLDVDNAACDTIGETLDRVNASANWRAVRLDSLRSDLDSANKLIDVAATQATGVDGLGLKWDTSVVFKATQLMAPPFARSMQFYLTGSGTTSLLNSNPWNGKRVEFQYMNATSTYGSGTSAIQVITEQPFFAAAGETVTENIAFQLAGGATTVNKEVLAFIYSPLILNFNERAICRINNSAAASVIQLVCGARTLVVQ